MKRSLISALLIGFCLTSLGLADMIQQVWLNQPWIGDAAGVAALHEDRRPGMVLDPAPDQENVLTESWWDEGSSGLGNDYTANLWGWVKVPETGTYTWHTHGDDHHVLYVSSNESMANLVEVKRLDGWTNVEEWDSGGSGTSTPAQPQSFDYVKNELLAVYAIQLQGTGGHNFGIGWTQPGAAAITYITDHVTSIAPSPTKARGPGPAVDTSDVSRDTSLTWRAGEFAATHNVYFGTNFGDVNDRAPGALIGDGVTETTLDPGRLEFGETYYWTVDEVNGAPDFTLYAGEIWSFTAEPEFIPISINDITVTASSTFGESGPENTINGSGLADDLHGVFAEDMWISGSIPATIEYAFDRAYKLQELWIWNSNQAIESFIGFGAKDVVIEHSLEGQNWIVLDGVGPLAQAPGSRGYAHNTTIDFGGAMAQHVRVTVNSVHGIAPQGSLSELRFFYIPTFASNPSPETGATDVAPDVTLAWGRDGREAGSHDVYVGTDSSNLSLAGSVSESSFDTLALDLQLGQSYAWRVDEVNEAMDPSTWTGDVWSFTTVETIIVDDMESYRDEEFLEIWAFWVDGFNDDSNGSVVGTGDKFLPETSTVQQGSQSLRISYDNSSAPLSEVTRSFDPSLDWSGNGIQSLSLYFHGAVDNTGQLYVKINGSKIEYAGDPADIARPAWQVWNVDLSEFSGARQNVTELTIGVDGANGKGLLYIDTIRLSPTTAADDTAQDPQAPAAAGLVAHWAFEGDFSDATGKGHDGQAYGIPTIVDDPIRGQVLEVSDGDRVGVSDSPDLNYGADESVTLAAWVHMDPEGPGGWRGVVVKGRTAPGGDTAFVPELYGFFISPSDNWHANAGGIDGAAHAAAAGWHHLAFVQDGSAGVGNFYVDGVVAISGGAESCDTTGRDLFIGGSGTDVDPFETFQGRLDDVRIYNYALSALEIQYLALAY